MNKYCVYCGNKMIGNEKFCNKCGKPVKKVNSSNVSNNNLNNNGLSVSGFVFSILGFVTCGLTTLLGLVLSIIGFVNSKKKLKKDGMALAGIIISSLMIIIWVICGIYVVVTAVDVTVEDFSTKTYNEAVEFCNHSELSCYIKKEYSDSVSEGEFVRQSIEPGEVVKSYYYLDVYYSKGEKPKKSKSNNNSKNEKDDKTESEESKNDNYENLDVISSEELKNNFINACKEINMDVTGISSLEKKEDWNSGPRYTFMYKGQVFILYALDNGEVSSITIANNKMDKIYLDGYESVDVNDFIFSNSLKTTLIVQTEDKIKTYLKNPSSANFKQSSIAGVRRYDIYQLTGSFTAKNSYNAKVESKFTIEFRVSDGNYTIVYLNIDGVNKIGTGSNLKSITRSEKKKDFSQAGDGSITIIDGILGEYGKKDKFDGEEYIRYYIPAGTYKVEALTKNAMFYIETIKLHKEDGYDTATTIKTIKLNNVGDTDSFTITKDQCISLVMYTQIKLTKE